MIGLISDTHDNVENVKKAVELFQKHDVDFVLHLGDVVAPATIKFFSGLVLKVIKGNCDGDIEGMKRMLSNINGEYLGEEHTFRLGGKKIYATHGIDEKKLGEIIRSKKYDYVLHGHTHFKRDEKIKNTRVINPGAQYWGSEHTIVLFDPKIDRVEFISLK